MIIEIEPGGRYNVPAEADYAIRMATSFTNSELTQPGTTIALPFKSYAGTTGEIGGTVSGTDVLFLVTPAHFSPGEWTINPRLVVSGRTRRWPKAAILVVEGPLTPVEDCGC